MTPGLLAIAIAANFLASAADVATSRNCAAMPGVAEANTFMRGPAMPAVKVGMTITVNWASIRLWKKGKHKAAIGMAVAPAVAWGAAALSNHRLCR